MAITSSMVRDITMRIVNPDTTHEEFLEETSSSGDDMTPIQLAAALNRIASKIDASSNPSRELVLKDLNSILASMEHEAGAKEWIAALGAALGIMIGGATHTISQKIDKYTTKQNETALKDMNDGEIKKFLNAVADKFDLAHRPDVARNVLIKSGQNVNEHMFASAWLAGEGFEVMTPIADHYNLIRGGKTVASWDKATGELSDKEFSILPPGV